MPMFIDAATVEQTLTTTALQFNSATQALANSTLALTVTSSALQFFTGSTTGQIVRLPDATTLLPGYIYTIVNQGTVSLAVQNSAGGALVTVPASMSANFTLQLNGTTAGTWVSNLDSNSGATLGTVTSVALSLPSFITVSGSPITTSGTLTGTLASQSANTVFIAPNGSSGAPTFRLLVAADIPALSYVTSVATGTGLTGGPITSSGTISLATIANNRILANISGGTAAPTANTLSAILDSVFSSTQGSVLYRSGAAWTALGPGTSGQFLQTGGAAANPAWATDNSGTVTSVAMSVPAFLSIAGSPITSSGTLAVTLSGSALPIANGGTGVTSVTTSPTASAWAGWDANKNLSANNHINGYTTTATSGGTTTLVAGSTYQQYFTGSSAQTVVLPVTSTLVLGQTYLIANNSSNTITVNSSGGGTVTTIAAGDQSIFTAVSTSLTTPAAWSADGGGPAGTVTSVAMSVPAEFSISGSPITTAGTLAVTKANQSANTVWAGPVSGAAAAPTFRVIDPADLPDLSQSVGVDTSCFEDFLLDEGNTLHSEFSFAEVTASGGTATVASSLTGNNFAGAATAGTGTTSNSTGRGAIAGFNSVGKITLGGLRTIFEQRVRIPTLSTGGTTFTVEIGLMNNTASGLPTNGVFFYYTDTVNSGQWRCVSRSGSTSTNNDSGIAVVANQWYKLRADINAAGNSILFYIDGVQIGSAVTTNIPTVALFPAGVIEKSSTSTTSATMNIDYFSWKIYR